MRINAKEASYEDIMNISVKVNGIPVDLCMWFDTELGIAECAFAVSSEFKREDGKLRKMPLYAHDEDYEYTQYTYYLHTFEVWQNGIMVAKV